jgi:hypothetical protein
VPDTLRSQADRAIASVVEAECPPCRVELLLHDGHACCPCCRDSYKVPRAAWRSGNAPSIAALANIGKLSGPAETASVVHAGSLETAATPQLPFGPQPGAEAINRRRARRHHTLIWHLGRPYGFSTNGSAFAWSGTLRSNSSVDNE